VVAVVAGEVDQFFGFCDDGAAFGVACDADRAAASHLYEAVLYRATPNESRRDRVTARRG
jgi:hypothetical protein